MNAWHRIGRQLQHPQGRVGRVVGHAMRLLNARPNEVAIAALGIEPKDDVLELGFGPGHALAQMARLAPQGTIHGLDASPAMLAQAWRRNKQAVVDGRVQLRLGDWYPLQLPDASLDKILAVNVIYFWKQPERILAECYRVLRVGGAIAIYATEASTMKHWKFADSETHRLYTASDLRHALSEGGFADEDIRIEPIALPAGIEGILAVAQKTASRTSPLTH